MSRISAALWAAGALLACLSMILPRPEGYRLAGVAATAAVGLLAAGGTLLAAPRITLRMYFALVLAGVLVITAGCYFVGPQGSSLVAMLYIWVGIYAFYFFRRLLAMVIVVAIGVAYATLLALQPDNNFAMMRWAFVMVTIVATSALVSYLVELALRLVRSERAARMEAERVQAELRMVGRHKSQFLANASHELRTPLNAIIGFSEVLKEKMFGDLTVRQTQYVEDICASGRHLLSLINDVLDLSKVEAGRMELELSTFPAARAIREGAAMMREWTTRHGIEIEIDLDPGLGVIEADERKLKQVLFNLLSNAVKFSPEGAKVEIVGHTRDGVLEVSVRDSGIGIPPEEQPKIFEEFYQVEKRAEQPSRGQEGTGLGLALAKRFVELHGGRIEVESIPGAGSTFAFTLPLRQSTLEAAKAGPRG